MLEWCSWLIMANATIAVSRPFRSIRQHPNIFGRPVTGRQTSNPQPQLVRCTRSGPQKCISTPGVPNSPDSTPSDLGVSESRACNQCPGPGNIHGGFGFHVEAWWVQLFPLNGHTIPSHMHEHLFSTSVARSWNPRWSITQYLKVLGLGMSQILAFT